MSWLGDSHGGKVRYYTEIARLVYHWQALCAVCSTAVLQYTNHAGAECTVGYSSHRDWNERSKNNSCSAVFTIKVDQFTWNDPSVSCDCSSSGLLNPFLSHLSSRYFSTSHRLSLRLGSGSNNFLYIFCARLVIFLKFLGTCKHWLQFMMIKIDRRQVFNDMALPRF